MSAQKSRSGPRAEHRSEQILEQAATMFAERGFAGTDVQEVADALGIGKGTVYRHFKSKRELFLAAVDRGMRLLGDQVDRFLEDVTDPLDRIRAGVRAYLSFFDEYPQLVELLIQERAEFRDREPPTYFEHQHARIGRWRDLLEGLMADGRVRRMSVERITDVLSDLLYGTIFTNHFAGRSGSFEDQAESVLDVVLHGVLTDSGRRSYGEAP